jgi:competence protein ComFC
MGETKETETRAGLSGIWGRGVNAMASFLYPEICQYCREQWAEAADGFICRDCARGVQVIRPPFCDRCGLPFSGAITSGPFKCSNCHELKLYFTSGRAAVAAEGMMLDLIHRWKYQRALWLEPFLLRWFLQEAVPWIDPREWNLIIPVPLHALKEREREFNQAEHLARPLAVALGMELNCRAVIRQAATRTQTRLTRAERDDNMRQAFTGGRGIAEVRGRRVVLVDDVLTTGSTTSACARVLLREGGAAEVCVWTLARGLLQ